MEQEKRELFLAWQDPIDRRWLPVGYLEVNEKGDYVFRYTLGSLYSNRFMPIDPMRDLGKVYEFSDLLPWFENRMLSKSRPEYKRYIEWLNVKDNGNDPLTVLAITEGVRGTDSFEVFKCPVPNSEGEYEVQFFSHGLRYLRQDCINRVNELDTGESLRIMLDVQNEYDYMALALRTEDPLTVVGYCPRYLTQDFYTILEECEPSDIEVSVQKVNIDAPLNIRLLCKIVAPWPENFKPCSGPEYKPIRIYKRKEVKEKMARNQYGFGRSKEQQVARSLRGKGATVKLSPGSRGAADLTAKFPSGRTWKVQVKATRGSFAASPSRRDLGRLKQGASRSGATPVVTKVTPKGMSHTSARSGKKLKP